MYGSSMRFVITIVPVHYVHVLHKQKKEAKQSCTVQYWIELLLRNTEPTE